MMSWRELVFLSAVVLFPGTVVAQYADLSIEPSEVKVGEKEHSPYLNRGYPQHVYRGDTYLHRNIIFSDGKDEADRVLPFSNFDSVDPEDLWSWMATYEEKVGGWNRTGGSARKPGQSEVGAVKSITKNSTSSLSQTERDRSHWIPSSTSSSSL